MQMEERWKSNAQLFSPQFAAPTNLSQPEKLEIGMNLQVASNGASLFSLPRVPSSELAAKEIRLLHWSIA